VGVRLLEALGEHSEDDRVQAIRQLGAGDQDAIAKLGERLGVGPATLSDSGPDEVRPSAAL
jgi:hypothetical protein